MIIEFEVNKNILEEYKKFYFKENPKRRKFPFKSPILPSLNDWIILTRPAMNDLKQKWTNFGRWLIIKNGYKNKKISKCKIEVIYYFKDKRRRDADNYTPKNILDGFVKEGLLIDDSFFYVERLEIIYGGIDKENPRTKFRFIEKEVTKNGK